MTLIGLIVVSLLVCGQFPSIRTMIFITCGVIALILSYIWLLPDAPLWALGTLIGLVYLSPFIIFCNNYVHSITAFISLMVRLPQAVRLSEAMTPDVSDIVDAD